MRFMTVLAGLSLVATVYGQSIMTPVFVHKDGEASAIGYTGTEKDIAVDGMAQQSVGWITFQTTGVVFSKAASAKLTLYVKSVSAPGTLGIYPLIAAVTAPENNLPLASVPMGATAAATVPLGSADVEKMVQVDVTALLKAGAFHGVALKSDDGLVAGFDSKEGRLAPVILLTHDIAGAAAQWHSGVGVPAASFGKDGDYYLNTATGDVSAKNTGAWSVVTNLVGPTGAAGPTGATGAKGEKGEKGDQGSFPSGTAKGDMQYWDGTKWVMISAGQPGQALSLSGSSIPQWSQIPGTVTDIDGNVYHTIVIGNQEWTVENWRSTKYNDGTAIPLVTDGVTWHGLSTPAYCWYNNVISNKYPYGALYNWYVVSPTNPKQIAPAGWRVPSDADWTALENYLIANKYNYDFTTSVNKVAKSMAAQSHWSTTSDIGDIGNNLMINNASGFSALPGGYRHDYGGFFNQSATGYWWSASEFNASEAWNRNLYDSFNYLYRISSNKLYGFSVRLVRDLN